MSDITGTDDELIRRQQEKDLGHPLDPTRKPGDGDRHKPAREDGRERKPEPPRPGGEDG